MSLLLSRIHHAAGASRRQPARRRLFARLRVGVDQLAGLVFFGCQDRDGLWLAELLDIMPLDAVVLRPDRPGLGPLAIRAKGDVTLDRVKRVRVYVCDELVVIEGLRRGDRVAEDLQFAEGEGRQ